MSLYDLLLHYAPLTTTADSKVTKPDSNSQNLHRPHQLLKAIVGCGDN